MELSFERVRTQLDRCPPLSAEWKQDLWSTLMGVMARGKRPRKKYGRLTIAEIKGYKEPSFLHGHDLSTLQPCTLYKDSHHF